MGHAGDKSCVVFRVDASARIGTGHVMRCLALAGELSRNGVASRFVCRAHQGHMAAKIRSQGHEVVLLSDGKAVEGPDYASWLGADWETDADETTHELASVQPLWLIADHYAIDARWERRVREATGVKLMVIDGQANRQHECDLLLDQTCSPEGESRWNGLLPQSCKLLVGPRYALLRLEFAAARETVHKRPSRVERIFVAFGGVDQPDATSMVLDAIAYLGRPDITVDVVAGSANPHRDRLAETCRKANNVHLHVDPPDVASLMAMADLAVSAGGTMLLEQCYLYLPSIVVSIADNQTKSSQALHDAGAVWYLGDIGSVDRDAVRQAVSDLMADPPRFQRMQEVDRKLMAKPDMPVSEILLSLVHETI